MQRLWDGERAASALTVPRAQPDARGERGELAGNADEVAEVERALVSRLLEIAALPAVESIDPRLGPSGEAIALEALVVASSAEAEKLKAAVQRIKADLIKRRMANESRRDKLEQAVIL